ncbi:preprotein translocase subunit YajC [Microbacterium sp. 1.5R]|uniref:preprotein translocase subunit YajC n=1 Tax=Microbacterium sp. 1.5R TaxID=1916917 RepID=UPI0028CB4B6E|nr:preprotein translocase subunit YajC [Microbacterium sp. 1.5R]
MPMEILLFGLLAVLVVFMFVNGRRRQKQMKAEQEEKATKTVPGVKVLLQGGIYGTIVAYDHDDLDSPALVEIAPGTVIEVHSQAILRIVEPKDLTDGVDVVGDEAPVVVEETPVIEETSAVETPEETRRRLERDADDK